jgi:hypothetical protein
MTAAQTARTEQSGAAAASDVASALRRHACDLTALIGADARLAGVSFVAMINGVVLSGLSSLTAWGLLIAMLIWWAGATGLPMGPVFGALALLHVVIAFLLWRATMRLARHLEFRATRRQLRLSDEDSH